MEKLTILVTLILTLILLVVLVGCVLDDSSAPEAADILIASVGASAGLVVHTRRRGVARVGFDPTGSQKMIQFEKGFVPFGAIIYVGGGKVLLLSEDARDLLAAGAGVQSECPALQFEAAIVAAAERLVDQYSPALPTGCWIGWVELEAGEDAAELILNWVNGPEEDGPEIEVEIEP